MIKLAQNSNIRRIDELGRIVIPKDIRKKLHIKENEPLEIFIENDEIKISKYSVLPDIIDYMKFLIDIGNRITNNKYIITDREKILIATDERLENTDINEKLEKLVTECREEKNITFDEIINNINVKGYANIVPIIIDNDRSGIIIEYSQESKLNSTEVIKIFKSLIEKNLNNY